MSFEANGEVQVKELNSDVEKSSTEASTSMLEESAGWSGWCIPPGQRPTDSATMKVTKMINGALKDGNLDGLQDLLIDTDTKAEQAKLQKSVDKFNSQHNNVQIELSSRGKEDTLVITSESHNSKIGCGGGDTSYELTVKEDSASATYSSNVGIRSVVDEPTDVTRATKHIQNVLAKESGLLKK